MVINKEALQKDIIDCCEEIAKTFGGMGTKHIDWIRYRTELLDQYEREFGRDSFTANFKRD